MATGFTTLKNEVIENGLCTRCGGCYASCPVDALSFTTSGIELTGDCIECGNCTSICPGAKMDFTRHEKRLFNKARGTPLGSSHGIFMDRMYLSAGDREIYKTGYYGGRVTAILIHALENGLIDAALLTDWSGTDHFSIGKGIIARNRDGVIKGASSKYVFSPVLGLLKDVARDNTIKNIAVVGLPCHIHSIRNMETHKGTSHLTEKIRYVIGLNCGGANLDEDGWKKVIMDLTGVDPASIRSFRAFKTSGFDIRFKMILKDGKEIYKDMKLSEYLGSLRSTGVWDRCRMCPDYSSDLSDITFGMPYIRTEKGETLIRSAIDSGDLVRSKLKKRLSQKVVDIVIPLRKLRSARRNIRKRKKNGDPYPIFK